MTRKGRRALTTRAAVGVPVQARGEIEVPISSVLAAFASEGTHAENTPEGAMMSEDDTRVDWFVEARFGMLVHYGLYSLLGRGEWVLNRESIPLAEYRKLAGSFTAEDFDSEEICELAVRAGMKYVTFATMHHDGFRLYDTELSDFNSVNACRRDLVEELVTSARKRGLKISLYHSLNNWMDQPDAVTALEDADACEEFIKNTHDRIKELVTRFNPVDVMWYDGWWPFNAEGWKSGQMNKMVSKIQPHILFNSRNCLPGDFATPEGHLSAPRPWRPWEACMTMNESWGYHRGDNNWKSPQEIVALLAKAAAGKGNLLLNIGPCGDGSIPKESVSILESVGEWVERNGECVFATDIFNYGLEKREPHHRADWSYQGPFTAKGTDFYQVVRHWPGETLTIAGLECNVRRVVLLGENRELPFTQMGNRVALKGLPETAPDPVCPVLRFECDREPSMYLSGGMRTPKVPHPPYDPAASDIQL